MAVATENANSWYFSPGDTNSTVIGTVVVCISKESGRLHLVDMLSYEGFEEVQNSLVLDLPSQFKAQEGAED